MHSAKSTDWATCLTDRDSLGAFRPARRVVDVPREPLTEDDVERREWQARRADPESHRAAARDYEAWAADPHPDDEVGVAALLVSAGEQLALAGDDEGALSLYQRAVADGGLVSPDARCFVMGALLDLGRHDDADALASALLKSRPRDPFVYLFVGEGYQSVGRLDDANRWMTSGVFRLWRAEDVPEDLVVMLMRSRRRVRQAIGFDEDEYDVVAAPDA